MTARINRLVLCGSLALGALAPAVPTAMNASAQESTRASADAHRDAAARGPVHHFSCNGGTLRLYRKPLQAPPACDTPAPTNYGICFSVSAGQPGFESVANRSDRNLVFFPSINCSGRGKVVEKHHTNPELRIFSFARS
ncbi:hypothetical protein [Actinomadura luteofluorescens]|uniref:hypothetical protein n=1 Tax=Actinomadura luteofluorescens TaxID=46163 RepID=UPI003D89E760